VSKDEKFKDNNFVEKLVHINRVSKTVKGGKNLSFAALVVIGDGKGRVGYGQGKAREVPDAIRKATEEAKRTMIRVPMREGRCLHHDNIGVCKATSVILRTAPAGTGVIAGSALRAVFDVLGIQDVVAKLVGSANPYNVVKACFNAFEKQTSPKAIAAKRGKKVADIIARR
jgi:small subunit ribosomal protein S5